MAGWWQTTIENAGKLFDSGIKVLDGEAKRVDSDLGAQRGIFPAILRGFVKVGRLFIRLVVWGMAEFFPGLKTHGNAILTGQVFELPKADWDATIERIGSSMALDAESIRLMKSYYQSFAGSSPLIQGLALVQMYVNLFTFVMGPGMGKIVRSLMRKIRPLAPGPGEVLGAAALDPELDRRIWETLRNNGFEDKDIELMFAATYARHDLMQVQLMYYRKILDEAGAVNRLQELRFTPERIKEIMASWKNIPSMQDMILMLAHEAFEPNMIAMYGLDEAYPQEFTDFASRWGFAEEWAKRYWISHWVHPGLQTVLEMYHRDQLTEEQMWNYFSLVEIPPFWRQRIMNISYNVITRVDARRMWELGVITDEKQLHTIYRHMGYSPEDATLMVQWTKTYAESTDKELTRTDIIHGYTDGDLSADEAVMLLKRAGYAEDTASYLVYSADLSKIRVRRTNLTKIVHDKYTSNLVSEAEARARLVGMEYSLAQVNDLLEQWSLERMKGVKLPSKTDLDKFLKAGVIQDDVYKQELATLGYSERYIGWYYELAKRGIEASGE